MRTEVRRIRNGEWGMRMREKRVNLDPPRSNTGGLLRITFLIPDSSFHIPHATCQGRSQFVYLSICHSVSVSKMGSRVVELLSCFSLVDAVFISLFFSSVY